MAKPSVVVDPRSDESIGEYTSPHQELVSYVIGNVKAWRDVRDGTYKEKWDHFYNVWRGNWKPETKAKAKERSKLISPASMMAVDLTVAEIVEAIFGREFFFNVPDDIADQQKEDVERVRAQLHEDLYRTGVIRELTEVFLNGALYGTGIVKIMIDVVRKKYPILRQTENEQELPEMVQTTREIIDVFPVAIEPGQLVVDPAATRIDDMLGVAHEYKLPLHVIRRRQREGVYNDDVTVGPQAINDDSTYEREEDSNFRSTAQNWAFITEWHGLVPAKLLLASDLDEEVAEELMELSLDEEDMVEAVITIANESELLRAMPNPCIMDSRAILAYQHDTVPNQFWGRGVMEKAEHPQRAMDAEMRARIDHLAWVSNPMIAGDLTRLPARMNMDTWPGKFWGTKGPPGEILQEFRFADVNASSFQHTQELERQVQQATGALDSIMSIRGNIRDETAAGSAISASGFIKRSKRTMYNIEFFMSEMIRRIIWRKMQFEPTKYPTDYDFQVKGAVGMMARELEQQQMINLLQYVPQESPPFFLLLKGIMEASSSPASGAVARAVDQMMQPPSEEEQQQQKALKDAQMQMVFAELENKQADTQLKQAQAANYGSQAQHTAIKADLEDDKQVLENLRTIIDQREVANQERQMDIQEKKLGVEYQKVRAMQSKPSQR